MTTERTEALDSLADALLEGAYSADHTQAYEALATLLQPNDHVELGARLELCPVHFCDIRICLDDEVHGDEVYAPAETTTTVYSCELTAFTASELDLDELDAVERVGPEWHGGHVTEQRVRLSAGTEEILGEYVAQRWGQDTTDELTITSREVKLDGSTTH